MSKKNPLDAFEDLVLRHSSGKPQPASVPTHLQAHTIKRRPEVFQHRRPSKSASEGHIRELAVAAKAQDLDPLTVWWDGRTWTLIDGHHRAMAYLKAGKGMSAIPVEVFDGTPADALARAARANTKVKLMMSVSEKSTAAWRIVVLVPNMSKSAQAVAAGVSERLVASMRTAKGTLVRQGYSPSELAEMTWENARRTTKGEDTDDWSPEEEEKRIEQMALALRKALGATAERQPNIFWQAIEVYSPQLARAIADDLAQRREEDAEDFEVVEK
ncbi:hypothetical protein [Rhodoferax sp. U11-2br]|uniref:hypothetical protein n=1 Tax=Rhodoferax sp. U11-2br TaxID=2838878 RepID=UPI001BE4F96C|nr:hypothetical protein [Rhodoferax sp. U11-2br]MBT3066580.1 hypothetical protein [Rhodoferax sp. U11-2br]